jgi:hypothetical protein
MTESIPTAPAGRRPILVLAAVLLITFSGVIVAAAGPAGLLYAVIYGAGVLPGVPAGLALFGRRHAAGWIAGALFGYVLLALTVWAATSLGARSASAPVLVWAVVLAIMWVVFSGVREPFVKLPPWRRQDTAGLLLVLLLVPALFLFPYKNLGAADAQGRRHYRAYFTADYLWHVALTAELAKYAKPPVNPYLAPEPLHYYWTYFTVPAAVSRYGPPLVADVDVALKTNAMATALLFLSAIFVATWCAVPSAAGAAIGVALAVVAASAEGAYTLVRDVALGGAPLELVKDLNVDALSNWYFRGLRIDGLARSMWYTPQHSMSVALGLMALPVAGRAALPISWGAIGLAGVALGGSTLFNPLLGGMFSLIYGLVVALAALARRAPGLVIAHALACIPVGAALAWCVGNQMVDGAGSTLHFGVAAFARFRPILTFCLSLGPLLVAAAAGLGAIRTRGQAIVPAVVGFFAGIGLLYFVVLIAETSYVGFRAGQIIQVSLAPLAAAFFAHGLASSRRRLVIAVVVVLFGVGLPTTVIDAYNAQDIRNLGPGPGFRWTIVTTPEQQEAFAWIRARTRAGAIVQSDPIVRARETWTQIPTFAQRRMAAGLPISLINTDVYEARSLRVHEMYSTSDGGEAWRIADELGIDFIYVDAIEREGLPPGFEEKFETNPGLFRREFANAEARVYSVLGR